MGGFFQYAFSRVKKVVHDPFRNRQITVHLESKNHTIDEYVSTLETKMQNSVIALATKTALITAMGYFAGRATPYLYATAKTIGDYLCQ